MSVENGALRAVLAIDIEEYLYGVVAYETVSYTHLLTREAGQ